ncbi:hypothetical protein NQ317_017910 [Molorchus minor]|uniref:Outer dense fiber protein 3 n=1 Tax=Molorchus minor TaxID=1323400 RepID=A0ABQ9J6U5_9CUCU|nr:hypothetical protein NQ317_017910 [Molorchus minor]
MPRKNIGPGPGKYLLPPLTGYPSHDYSRYRNPQYSIGVRLPLYRPGIGPGPQYDVRDMTPYGKATPPCFSMKSRQPPLKAFQAPGPGTYRNELVPRMKEARPPAYSMAFRTPPLKKFQIPGPDVYTVPTTIGPKVPDKSANAAYSMSYRQPLSSKEKSPGPARYDAVNADIFKNKLPDYTISPRVFPPTTKMVSPGPIYKPRLPEKPGYSFGLRTDMDPYITAADNTPCKRKEKVC